MPATKISTAMQRDPEGTNKFLASELYCEKCNLNLFQHLPEAKFLTPDTVVKDEVPRAHEVRRHWTERNISAQQTGSDSFASVLLSSLFTGVTANTKQAAVILNMSPYHGNMEMAAFDLTLSREWTGPRLATFSTTWEALMVSMAKKRVRDHLFRSWKSQAANDLLAVDPNSEAYKAEPPVFLGSARRPVLQVLTISDETKTLKVPQELVQQYGRDPLRKDEWLNIVKDVEQMFGGMDSAPIPSPSEPSETSSTSASHANVVFFPDDTLKNVSEVDASKIHCQFPGRERSYSWLVIKEDEVFKGYVVAETPTTVDGLALAYGRGSWAKGKLEEVTADGPTTRDVVCAFTSFSERLVLEGARGDGPLQTWVQLVYQVIKDYGCEGTMADMNVSTHKVIDVSTTEESRLTNALGNPDNFVLEAKEGIVFKPDTLPAIPAEYRHTNLAGLPPKKVLSDSPALHLVWRVKYFEPSHEIAPRKPLWYFKTPITLSKAGEMRRVF